MIRLLLKPKYLLRILLIISVVWMWIPNNNFVYPTFNLYFTFCGTAIVLFMITLYWTIRKKILLPCGVMEMGVLVWIAYIGIYSAFYPTETYNSTYLFGSGLYYMGCVLAFRMDLINFKSLGVALTGGALLQSVVCLLQLNGSISSYSSLFSVTGTSVDPNLTAMWIAWAVPFLFYSILTIKRHRKVLVFIFLLFLSALVLLKCRTAYVGVLVSILYILWKEKKGLDFFRKQSLIRKWTGVFLVLILLGSWGSGLYYYKQASADGRMFIWKNTVKMIQEKPVTGYGYGLFEKSYNEFQTLQLEQDKTSETERRNARFTLLAFNDFLEQTASGGLIGGLLFTGIVLLAVCLAFKEKESWITACLISIGISMSVNFVVQSVTLWMVALSFFAGVSVSQKPILSQPFCQKVYSCTALSLLAGLAIYCSYRGSTTYTAQRTLKQAVILYRSHPQEALFLVEKNLPRASTSECYLRNYAYMLSGQGKEEKALKILEEAKNYTAHPAIEREIKRLKKNPADR